jgi:hypothetical protein
MAFLKIQTIVSQNILCADPLWLWKITMDPIILAYINIECLDDRCPKLKTYVWELILDSYKSIPVAYVTMHCKIWPYLDWFVVTLLIQRVCN